MASPSQTWTRYGYALLLQYDSPPLWIVDTRYTSAAPLRPRPSPRLFSQGNSQNPPPRRVGASRNPRSMGTGVAASPRRPSCGCGGRCSGRRAASTRHRGDSPSQTGAHPVGSGRAVDVCAALKATLSWAQYLAPALSPRCARAVPDRRPAGCRQDRQPAAASPTKPSARKRRCWRVSMHRSIARLEGFYESDDAFYIVQEYVGGGELFTGWRGRAVLEADAADVPQELASALALLHGQGLCHRDIKPEPAAHHRGARQARRLWSDRRDGGQAGARRVAILAAGAVRLRAAGRRQGGHGRSASWRTSCWSASPFDPYSIASDAQLRAALSRSVADFPDDCWGERSAAARAGRRLLAPDRRRRLTVEQLLRQPWLSAAGGAPDAPMPNSTAGCGLRRAHRAAARPRLRHHPAAARRRVRRCAVRRARGRGGRLRVASRRSTRAAGEGGGRRRRRRPWRRRCCSVAAARRRAPRARGGGRRGARCSPPLRVFDPQGKGFITQTDLRRAAPEPRGGADRRAAARDGHLRRRGRREGQRVAYGDYISLAAHTHRVRYKVGAPPPPRPPRPAPPKPHARPRPHRLATGSLATPPPGGGADLPRGTGGRLPAPSLGGGRGAAGGRPKPTQQRVNQLLPGDAFGETALLRDAPRNATVRCTSTPRCSLSAPTSRRASCPMAAAAGGGGGGGGGGGEREQGRSSSRRRAARADARLHPDGLAHAARSLRPGEAACAAMPPRSCTSSRRAAGGRERRRRSASARGRVLRRGRAARRRAAPRDGHVLRGRRVRAALPRAGRLRQADAPLERAARGHATARRRRTEERSEFVEKHSPVSLGSTRSWCVSERAAPTSPDANKIFSPWSHASSGDSAGACVRKTLAWLEFQSPNLQARRSCK